MKYTQETIIAMQDQHVVNMLRDSYIEIPIPNPAIDDEGQLIGGNVSKADHRSRYSLMGITALARE